MKKLIILVGLLFMAACASGGGGGMGYAGLNGAYGSPYINDSPSNPLGNGFESFGN